MSVYQKNVQVKGLIIDEVKIKGVVCAGREFVMGYQWMGLWRPAVGDLFHKTPEGKFAIITSQELASEGWDIVGEDIWGFQSSIEVATLFEPEQLPEPAPVPASKWHLKTLTGAFVVDEGTQSTDPTQAMVFNSAQEAFDYQAAHQIVGAQPVENLPDPVDTISDPGV